MQKDQQILDLLSTMTVEEKADWIMWLSGNTVGTEVIA